MQVQPTPVSRLVASKVKSRSAYWILLLIFSLVETEASARSRTARRGKRISRERHVASPGAVPSAPAPPPRRRWLSGFELATLIGPSFSYGKANPEKQGTLRTSLSGALQFERKLSRTFSLCPEISYAERGVSTTLTNSGGVDITGDISLSYLAVALPVKARFTLLPRWRIYFLAGPEVSIALSRRMLVISLIEVDLSNRFSQTDANLLLGTGLEYAVNADFSIVSQVRTHIGLADIDSTDASYYTRDVQLFLGAQFRL